MTSAHTLLTFLLLFSILIINILPVVDAQLPIDSDRFQCPSYNCDYSNCRLPGCLCANDSAPLNLSPQIVPQFVVFTFNDVVKREFYDPITDIFTKNRRNPTGRRIAATMFVSDEEGTGKGQDTTDYCLARKLWEDGHELASHSMSHRSPADWWRSTASVTEWSKQLTGQRDNMTEESKLPKDHVRGVRAPFLNAGGEKQFQAIASNGNFTYDSSLLLQGGPFWPFTLDYGTYGLKCQNGICPSNCYKSLWEVPLAFLEGPAGSQCTFVDFCLKDSTEKQITEALTNMYQRRYDGNRAPLVLNTNMRWFFKNQEAKEGLTKFIDKILNDDDTFVVSIEQLLAYMRKPVPLTDISSIKELNSVKKGEERKKKGCRTKRGTGKETAFFINGDTLVILEVVGLTLLALILIARDSE